MNEAQKTPHNIGENYDNEEFGLMELMIIFAKNKKLIIFSPVVVAFIAIAISFVLPEVYRASAKILPPQQAQSGATALLAQLGGVAGAAAGVAGLKNPNDMYIGMLKSRTVADKLIQRFDLKKTYGTDSPEKARKALDENTVISAGKDGLISIDVEDKNQKLVAPLANGYIDELVNLTQVLALTEASQRRKFFEQQLELSKSNLASAEMTLKRALDTRGVISVDSDSRAMLETIGRLRAQLSAKEIQLSSMRPFLTTTNPDYRRAEEELNGLRSELSKLENGRGTSDIGSAHQSNAQAGLENIKILRDVKYYQMLYELLAKQYEVARLDEAKNTALVQVLDPAVEPERKYKPQRVIIVLVSAALAFAAAIFWALIADAKQRALQRTDSAVKWRELQSHLWIR
jgi:tyrosine-protein kinase Etk/Wzc